MRKEFVVPPGNAGQRLDVFLSSALEGFSRSKIQHFIENSIVLRNGETAGKNSRLQAEDVVSVDEEEAQEILHPQVKPENIPLEILYEDEEIIAINKSAGMVVHPGNGNYEHTLVNALLHYASSLSHGFENDRPGIVHRLDKETSGVILIAKTDAIHSRLAGMFADRTIEKTYIGICVGLRPMEHGVMDMPLGRNKREPIKRSVQSDGKVAITEYQLLMHHCGISIVKFMPHTGRTHQIRVHCSSKGFPVLCDSPYGGGRDKMKFLPVLDRAFANRIFNCFNRQALHARTIAFTHPKIKDKITISAPFPKDFQEAFNAMDFREEV